MIINSKKIIVTVFIISCLLTVAGYLISKNGEIMQLTGFRTITPPKNIIFIIGDGMGFNTKISADYYQYGSINSQIYDNFPVKYAVSHYPAKTGGYPDALQWSTGYNPREMWSNFFYALNDYTESAASATAMATGTKTYNNSIGMDLNFQPLINLTQIAKSLNKSAGVVTSVEFSHATPAGFVAHNVTRSNYSSIAFEMLLNSKVDLIMGAGNPDYNNDGIISHNTYEYVGDSLCWMGLQAGNTVFQVNGQPDTVEDCNNDGIRDPWTLIQDKSQFQNLMNGNTPLRVLGVPKIFQTLQQSRSGDASADPYAVPFVQTVPTLAEMTKGALNVLDNNSNGFFLMVECGAIDWAAHGNQKGRLIEETAELNNTINAVIQWVSTNSSWSETMVIITADHETGMLWGPGSGKEAIFNPIINNGIHQLPGMTFYSTGHTNSLVPFFANGQGSQLFKIFADETDSVRGKFIQNSEIAQTIKCLWDADYIISGITYSGTDFVKDYTLDQNYPNPFNPSTTITFNLKKSGIVNLSVFDITGRLVKRLINNEKTNAGISSTKYDFSDLSSGVYFYTLVVNGNRTDTRKMVLVK